jgi:multisubunit Na+/H+ antiporter MnhG subunit
MGARIGAEYTLIGIASVLLALVIILIKYNNIFYYFLIIIAFILEKIGFGILFSKEIRVYEAVRSQSSYWKRLVGIFPQETIQNIEKREEDVSTKSKSEKQRPSMLVGISSIIMGVIGLFWSTEKVFPAILILVGIFFILMGEFYGKHR